MMSRRDVLLLLTNQVLDSISVSQRQSICTWSWTAYSKINSQKEPGTYEPGGTEHNINLTDLL